MKVIHSQLAADKAFRARFDREIAAARKVGGFYTAPVVDADTTGPRPWLATGFVDGTSLDEGVWANGPMPEESLLVLAAGLAEGLNAIHSADVIHRDLKPSNVMLASDGVRVIDFGIAQAANDTRLTGTGFIIGSPWFMSPEQADGHPVGPASDIFSMGGVLVYAATGESPFGGGSPAEQLYRVVHGRPRLDGLTVRLRALVAWCLEKDPARRPTAGQFLAQLPRVLPGPRMRQPTIAWWPAGARPSAAVPAHEAVPAHDAVAAQEAAQSRAAMATNTILGQGTPAPVLAPPPAGYQDAQILPPGRRQDRKWLRWGVPVAAITAAAGLIGGLLATAPGQSPGHPAPPVLRPTGLAIVAVTATSVSLTWSPPRTGPLPDSYSVLEDGSVEGTTPGSAPYFRAAKLDPATSYSFRVFASRGGKKSPLSASLTARTVTPPLSGAVFHWRGDVKYVVTSVDPPDPANTTYGAPGQAGKDPWTVTDCGTASCGISMSGTLFKHGFTMRLTWERNAEYAGTVQETGFTQCRGVNVTGVLSIRATITRAGPNGEAWLVTAWSGDATLAVPWVRGCYDDTFTFALTGT